MLGEVSSARAISDPIQSMRVPSVEPRRTFLLGRNLDVGMAGGFSLVLFGLFFLLVDPAAPTTSISWTAYYLSFAVNAPHFLISYQMLYGDYRNKIAKSAPLILAAIGVPVVLLLAMTYAALNSRADLLAYLVQAMYALVSWHYAKQTYGVVIVSSICARVYYSNYEKLALRTNLLAMGFLAWCNSNIGIQKWDYYGISYASLDLPAWVKTAAYSFVAINLFCLLALGFKKYIRENKIPPATAVIAVVALYLWFVPALYHPGFFYVIPFFHSLQYLLFAVALRKNRVRAEAREKIGAEFRWAMTKNFVGYLVLAVILGAIGFWAAPALLDKFVHYDRQALGPQFFLFAFSIFLNIHHYFIDSVIWKGSNKDLSHLLSEPLSSSR